MYTTPSQNPILKIVGTSVQHNVFGMEESWSSVISFVHDCLFGLCKMCHLNKPIIVIMVTKLFIKKNTARKKANFGRK